MGNKEPAKINPLHGIKRRAGELFPRRCVPNHTVNGNGAGKSFSIYPLVLILFAHVV